MPTLWAGPIPLTKKRNRSTKSLNVNLSKISVKIWLCANTSHCFNWLQWFSFHFNDQHVPKANNDFLQRRCRTKEQGVKRWTQWSGGLSLSENDSLRAVHDKTSSFTLTLTLYRLQAKDRRAWNAWVAYGQSPLLANSQVPNISISTRLPKKKLWSN